MKEGGEEGINVLFTTHPRPLFQICPGAETVVDFAREYQYSCSFSYCASCCTLSDFIFGFLLHGVDLGREFGK